MKALSLFTGYGGIDLALKDYISEVVAYVEIEEYAQKVIGYRMAEGNLKRAPILADVQNIQGSIGVADIIYGGFPCQDISVAGNGAGLAGERSGLFYEIIRLTKEIRPYFIFLENVPAIRTRGLEQVIKEFTEIGYDCRWTCLSASSVGANHKRERWFMLANSNSPRQMQDASQSEEWVDNIELVGASEKISNPNKTGLSNSMSGRYESTHSKLSNNFLRDWWATEPNVGRVVDGGAFRVDRIKALGNGVVPLQVKTAFELLIGIK